MLRLPRSAAIIAGLLLLGCEPPPPPPAGEALSVEASYRLMYNANLVGKALFVLDMDAAGNYRIAAFTTPAGELQHVTDHEVLETSQGILDAHQIRPASYEHSVLEGADDAVTRLLFDWRARTLKVDRDGIQHSRLLEADTHDRLSYLLLAQRLAQTGGQINLRIAGADAEEVTRLALVESQTIEVPYGTIEAVGVSRLSHDPDEQRMLWFDPSLGPLPISVVQAREGNRVEMQLESLNRTSGPR